VARTLFLASLEIKNMSPISPFLRKIKNLSNPKQEPDEDPEEDSEKIDSEDEEEKEEEEEEEEDGEELEEIKPKKIQKKIPARTIRKTIIKEKPAVPAKPVLKEPERPEREMRITKPQEQEKSDEKKWPEPEGQLAVDVYQTDSELVIQSTIAGVKPEDLDISAQGDKVVIRGIRENQEDERKNYFYQECYWGSFSREIILPVDADISRAEAKMVDGVLTIRIPKIEKEKKKKITVK